MGLVCNTHTHTQAHTYTGTDTDTHAQISTDNQTRKNTCLNTQTKQIVSITQESQGRATAAKARTQSICSNVVESLTCLLSVGDHVFIADGILT